MYKKKILNNYKIFKKLQELQLNKKNKMVLYYQIIKIKMLI